MDVGGISYWTVVSIDSSGGIRYIKSDVDREYPETLFELPSELVS